MNWSQFGPAFLSAFVGASVTDALFYGLLRALQGSERSGLWRAGAIAHPLVAFAAARIWTGLTCLSFLMVDGFLGLSSLEPTVMLASGMWLATVLPWVGTSAIYLTVRPAVLVVHLFGWLVKLFVCVGAAYFFL